MTTVHSYTNDQRILIFLIKTSGELERLLLI